MAKNHLTKAQKLLALLIAAGPAGIPNVDLAANPDVGWKFSDVIAVLRREGYAIETHRIEGGIFFRTVLVQTAPAPELPPIMALLLAAQEGAPRA